MNSPSKSIAHFIGILFSIIGLIEGINTCNQWETRDDRRNSTGSVPPKGDDHLEEAMEQLNQKQLQIAKGFHLDTTLYHEESYKMRIRSILPGSEMPDLAIAHVLLRNAVREETLEFIQYIKNPTEMGYIPSYYHAVEIRIIPIKMFFGVGRLSYLLKLEARKNDERVEKEKWMVFNYDLVNKKTVDFEDFFNLKSQASKTEFLDAVFGKSDILTKSELDKMKEFQFFFNKSEITFVFNEGKFPFTSYVSALMTSPHENLKKYITSRFHQTYLEARPYK